MPETVGDTWSYIPEEILSHIFCYLSLQDRHVVLRVCKKWAAAVLAPCVWSYIEVRCVSEDDKAALQNLHQFLPHIRHLKVAFDQSDEGIRQNICRILDLLAQQNHKLQALCIECAGENPYFYSGQDILQSIGSICQSRNRTDLQHLDFRAMPFTLDDGLVQLVASSSPNLHTLYLNNRTLVCNVTPEMIIELLKSCPKLSTLGVYYASLSEEVFKELVTLSRPNLRCLDIFCERMDKYIPVISEELWALVREKYPRLYVQLELDHTVPQWKILRILKPNIPVTELQLNTFAYMVYQIRFATANYSRTLEKLVLRTTSSEELDASLIDLARKCACLKEVHCFCLVSHAVVEAFLSSCPRLKSYTLKTSKEHNPWQPTPIL
ncbi:F-box/LRR-repeat protein 8-like [Erythrolamprus reginae]|uniref:F-box/LRR-repeat protein 8-like n=1 Tax=Erythrolamprus reginae TaxID=121349 RepID=UPI00396CF5AC